MLQKRICCENCINQSKHEEKFNADFVIMTETLGNLLLDLSKVLISINTGSDTMLRYKAECHELVKDFGRPDPEIQSLTRQWEVSFKLCK